MEVKENSRAKRDAGRDVLEHVMHIGKGSILHGFPTENLGLKIPSLTVFIQDQKVLSLKRGYTTKLFHSRF